MSYPEKLDAIEARLREMQAVPSGCHFCEPALLVVGWALEIVAFWKKIVAGGVWSVPTDSIDSLAAALGLDGAALKETR